MATRIGVDVGGTFTDLVFYDHEHGHVRVGKSLTTPAAPDLGVETVVSETVGREPLTRTSLFLHGTTVGLNSLLERRGAVVGVLATRGFRDVLELRRAQRAAFYDMLWKAPPPLVPRRLRLDVTERVRADGSVERPLIEADVRVALQTFTEEGVECVAVVFMNSHANPAHELAAAAALRRFGFDGDISLSHQVTGEFREYERTSTTVVDAYVRPTVARYLQDLDQALRRQGFAGEALITRSGGGSLTFSEGEERPVETVISGPAAGAMGCAELCRELGIEQGIGADVGGTSFDTCLIVDGRPRVKYEGEVAGMPLQIPWVDVRSIGAGGGSIAYVEGGLLHVGPRSAGADPGPVCYGRGGTEPSVTDAAATLGMLALGELASGVRLDLEAARASLAALGEKVGLDAESAAQGVLTIANVQMANAIRSITVEVGEDPRQAALVAFGGAGPLFGTLLARELEITRVVVPSHAGNFSAFGLLSQDLTRAAARTMVTDLGEEGLASANLLLVDLFSLLRERTAAVANLGEAVYEAGLDLRYEGQEYSLTVQPPLADERIAASPTELGEIFVRSYERTYGHTMEAPIQIVAVRATSRTELPRKDVGAAVADGNGRSPELVPMEAFSFAEKRRLSFDVVGRSALPVGATLAGPAIVTEETATTYLDSGFRLEVHPSGALLITDQEA